MLQITSTDVTALLSNSSFHHGRHHISTISYFPKEIVLKGRAQPAETGKDVRLEHPFPPYVGTESN